MAPPRSRWTVLSRTKADCPKGWELHTALKKNGTTVQYYTNVLGQKYYSRADLERNIKYSKKEGLSIYAPDFQEPTLGTYKRRRNREPEETFSSNNVPLEPKNQTVAENREETQCATSLLNLPAHTTENVGPPRMSSSLSSILEELLNDAGVMRALDNVMKDRPLKK